ncbi:MAG: hypothetical protein ACTSR8_16680 [Promethearchaeota archaeon]
MESDFKKIIISPTAYIKSLMYFQRFTNEFMDKSEFRFAYGLFLGYIEDEYLITDFIPLKDFNKEYIRFDKDFDKIFENVDLLNREYYDDQYPEYILGWGRNSLYNELEPTQIDKENHLYFQTSINPNSFLWIFDMGDLSIGYGFNIFQFKDDFKTLNKVSELVELRTDFAKDVLIEDLIQLAITIEEKRKNKAPLLKGRMEK